MSWEMGPSTKAPLNLSSESSNSLTLDQIKEMAEDDDEYWLRFYRAS